jgi:glutaredoxin
MNELKIVAYLKPTCGWSRGVRAVLRKYDMPYEDRDITNDPQQRQEMINKSGQELSPCVEIDGRMLPDISGAELEAYLLARGLISLDNRLPEAPIARPCTDQEATQASTACSC